MVRIITPSFLEIQRSNYWTDANTLYLFWTRYKANTLVNGNHLINDLVVKKMATFLTTINNWYTFQ
ncbi:hypothetical protein SMU_2124 [Streptococcus mutans UA159]|uniref:Uncharacterized protein n=1 Tax=Streptococcus mutans serotype c (strain ATCC 700610 / UA159) TaxID=210007 RepID=Q8DRU1_STRMU|nr:hypothetical protein SMU_2124 [Streptococcus mutans UA159]